MYNPFKRAYLYGADEGVLELIWYCCGGTSDRKGWKTTAV